MKEFKQHTLESAPEGSKPLLSSSIANFGWIPNQSAIMAEAPTLLEAYQKAHDLFIESSLNDTEMAVVWICMGMEHNCDYTIKAHEYIARKSGVDENYFHALKYGEPLPEKLEALRKFTVKLANCQGRVLPSDVETFMKAGFSRAQVFEVILGVSQKTMSNIMNNIVDTPVDEVFSNGI
ncbi:carboxymuconolactone decarboxylase family protein [Endozoicomonas sp. SM1973]|uniref:Carboxymuconolactone decarboxylase family protein n=1 Tax=Spartinivicinus marinus TaxID=2994442 RepID=A0A853IHJ0_9GAMM|nr:carboxymuconolactone decarboxylase family protein [Spartinivicinus marinus]MCX4027520.1 carboxymuconolactone decarboxylase family protein [Spartinivicinus marinus]NYZ68897.1 carboxymuconolactone decarboxylase family protein [Spartinivicinus marinus]